MNIPLFFKGFLIGISMAAPVGPLSILIIRRSLTKGHYHGIATALGVAIADGFYAAVAAFGLTAISSFLITYRSYLYIFGGSLLIFLGYKVYKSKPIVLHKPLDGGSFFSTLIQTSFLTLTNPMTILTFLAAFAGLGIEGHHEAHQAILLCLGVFCGSGLWFVSLSSVISHFRTRITPFVFMMINKISGAGLMLFGMLFIATVIKRFAGL